MPVVFERRCVSPLVAVLLLALVLSGGCDEIPLDAGEKGPMAEVVFRIAWPSPPGLGRAQDIPTCTTDLAVRIAHPDDQLKKGTVGHITRADTSITMQVEAGMDYQVEVLCARRISQSVEVYAPIGYGITKDLTLLENVTNYVSVTVDTLDLRFVRTDSISTQDTLAVELHLSIDEYWPDFSGYIPDRITCYTNDPDKTGVGKSVTLDEQTRDSVGVVFAWSFVPKNGGRVDFFVAGEEGDGLSDLSDAFGLEIQAAWSPTDFGESGDRFTILIVEGAVIVVSIPG